MRVSILLLFTIGFNLFAIAQEQVATESIENIIKAPLEIISGEAGKERNWESFKNLFLPNAEFIVVQHMPDSTTLVQTFPIEKFVEAIGPQYKKFGFLEEETGKIIHEYNGIASVFQSYFARHLHSGKEEKGINSYQLVYKEGRWWIASILWTSDTNGIKVPEKYLNN